MPTKITWLSLLLLVTASLTACTGYTSRKQYVIHQKAYLHAPRGPATTGPLPREGEVGLEGSIFGAASDENETTRLDGAPGHVVLDRGLSSRLLIGGLDRLEIGVGGSFGHSQLSTPAASDLETGRNTKYVSGSLDTHLRYRFVEAEGVGLYLLGELRSTIVPYKRDVDIYDRTTVHSDQGDYQTGYHIRRDTEFNNRLLLLPSGGVGGTFHLSPNAFLSVGAYAQDAPVFFGRRVTTENCQNSTGEPGDEQCTGKTPSDVSPLHHAFVGTAFGGFGIKFDDAILRFQGFYNAISNSDWNEHVPAGGRIALRFMF